MKRDFENGCAENSVKALNANERKESTKMMDCNCDSTKSSSNNGPDYEPVAQFEGDCQRDYFTEAIDIVEEVSKEVKALAALFRDKFFTPAEIANMLPVIFPCITNPSVVMEHGGAKTIAAFEMRSLKGKPVLRMNVDWRGRVSVQHCHGRDCKFIKEKMQFCTSMGMPDSPDVVFRWSMFATALMCLGFFLKEKVLELFLMEDMQDESEE